MRDREGPSPRARRYLMSALSFALVEEKVANENKQLLERLSQMLTKLVKAQKDHE